MREFRFWIGLSREEVLDLYRGAYHRVRVRDDYGTVIEIDADKLRAFTSESGIHGYFKLITTDSFKFIGLTRLR